MAGTIVADNWQNGDGTQNYKCRAWVNFNGTGTVAIRASGNVSSITDNANGDYTVNFTTAMPDTNYVVVCNGTSDGGGWTGQTNVQPRADTTSSSSGARVVSSNSSVATYYDFSKIYVTIFR